MRRKVVLCDVDGVVADFLTAFLKEVQQVTGVEHSPEEITSYGIEEVLGLDAIVSREVQARVCVPGFAHTLKPYPEAVEGIKRVAEISEVYFVTSPFEGSSTWVADRQEWLTELFGREQAQMVVHTKHKHLIAGDYLIEDQLTTLKKWLLRWPLKTGVVWDRPYNRRPESAFISRAHNWGDVLDLLA